MIRSLNHVNVTVSDIELALGFYRDLLGLEVAVDTVREGEGLARGVGVPGARLRNVKFAVPGTHVQVELIQYLNVEGSPLPPHEIQDSQIGHLCFEVQDVDEAYNRLTKAGVRCISEPVELKPSGIRFFYAYDPDGNVIEFATYPGWRGS